MADNGSELRNIAWTQVFPFLRLFNTFKLAIHASRLTLALACVLGCYFGGRILDAAWRGAGWGVLVEPGSRQSEVEAYATRSSGELVSWQAQVRGKRQELIAAAALELGTAEDMPAARRLAASQPARALTRSPRHETDIATARALVDQRLEDVLAALDADQNLSAEDKEQRRETLEQAADSLQMLLTLHDPQRFGQPRDQTASLSLISGEPGDLSPEDTALLHRVVRTQALLYRVKECEPQGPFITLLKYEERCFAAAIRGVCSFRWGLSGGAHGAQPSLLGSIVSAGSGVAWLVTQRPCFAVFYAILHFLIFALFGGAVCRHAAVQIARDESISLGEALRFAKEKYAGLLLAPLVPAGIFLLAAIVMFVGGVVAAIPLVGELLAGLLYGLALLGGFALAMVLIATVLGLHLMWPTIAVEGSDAFDAVTHAVGYVGQRAWNTGFYTLTLLLYGGVSFVMVRLIGMVLLKMTHVFTGAGMSLCGTLSSGQTGTFGKLDVMWHMPAWSDLELLPSSGAVPFWGTFWNGPLSGSEAIAMVLIMCWIFLVVGLVGAFVVSFFLAGSTQMYFLLRRDVDATDYDEVFYEEPEEELPPAEPTALTPAAAEEPGAAGKPADTGEPGAAPPPAEDSSPDEPPAEA